MIKFIQQVKNDNNNTVIKQLKQSSFWTNYGLQNKKYIVKEYFPQVEISDDVLVYEVSSSSRGWKYNLILPYGKMLHPKFLEQFLKFQDNLCENYNIWLYITDTLRSIEEQQNINNSSLNVIKGKSPKLSPHNLGLQIDFVPVVKNVKTKSEEWINSKSKSYQWTIVQQELNKVGLKWGGDFVSYYDPIHTQHPQSYQLCEQINQKNTQLINKLITEIDNTKITLFTETNKKNRPSGTIYWI